MNVRTILSTICLVVFANAAALAGPPVICHPVAISQASLPWADTPSWNGAVATYDTQRLLADTLALISPHTPVEVHMETLRRAAIYAATDPHLSRALEERLIERWRSHPSDTSALFDAGYFAEASRELQTPQMQALLKH